jgi:hypothetical protein
MHAMFGSIHWRVANAIEAASRRMPRAGDQAGQGTVEYVGLVLLVAVLMGGMVTAVGGLNSLPGKELADAITKKIVQAVQKVTFAK